MLQGLGAAVGELHRIGRGLVPAGAAPQPAPEQFWSGDWSDFDVWAAERWQSLGSDEEVRTAADLGPLRECIEIGLAALPVLRHPEVRNLTIAHDDLWTEHVLFDGHSRLVGIIDLDGLDVGDGVGDLAALLSDLARLRPAECSHVLRVYRTQVDVDESDLEAALSTVIRHHLLTLLERIRLWQEQPERRHDLIAPVGYWLDSLRSAVQMDKERWVSAVWSRSR